MFLYFVFFKDAEESWRKRVPVKYVVYDVLEKLEKFDGTGFQAVFNEVNLQEYPKLVPIHNRFEIGNYVNCLPLGV